MQSARVQKRVSETQKRVDNARLFDSEDRQPQPQAPLPSKAPRLARQCTLVQPTTMYKENATVAAAAAKAATTDALTVMTATDCVWGGG